MTKKLIIGIGNPGDRHIDHRGNIGFKVIDVLANNNNIVIKTKKKKALLGQGHFDHPDLGHEIILLKPQTFSYLCGEAALYIASFMKVPPEDVIVIHEDLDVPFAQLVIAKGSENTRHEAAKNLRLALASNEFVSIRIGIRNKEFKNTPLKEFLRQDFTPHESIELLNILNSTETAIRSIINGQIEEVLEKYYIYNKIETKSKGST